RAAPDRQGVLVGVDEHEAGHAHRRVPEALDGAALTWLAVEPVLDESGVELHDLLRGHGDLVGAELATQGLALDDRLLHQTRAEADALTDDDDAGEQVVTATGGHADHAVVLDDQ